MLNTRLLAAIAVVFAPLATVQAQEVMDWGPIIHAEAMGSAMAEAGREGSRGQSASRARSRKQSGSSASAARARSQCNRARGWAADGVEHPDLPRVLRMCQRQGY
jgi:hypothetical protein